MSSPQVDTMFQSMSIPEKMWYCYNTAFSTFRAAPVAYMTHTDVTGFKKRKTTGESAHSRNRNPDTFVEGTFENVARTGFKIDNILSGTNIWDDSADAYVLDPAGFAVSISAANLIALANQAPITDGEIKDPCVWVRANGNNVLLSLSMPLFQQFNHYIQHRANHQAKVAELVMGDVVSIKGKSSEYVFLGAFRVSWVVTPRPFSSYYVANPNTPSAIPSMIMLDDSVHYVLAPITNGEISPHPNLISFGKTKQVEMWLRNDQSILSNVDIEQLMRERPWPSSQSIHDKACKVARDQGHRVAYCTTELNSITPLT